MPNIRFTAPAPTHQQQQQQQQQSDEEGASLSSSKDGLLTKLYQENQDMKAKIAELEGMIGQAKPFDATHVKAMVQPFSGDDLMDIHTWLAKLEDTFRVLKVGKTEQLVAACGLLTGTAEVFRRITTLKDYDDFRTKLVEEFRYNKLTDETIVKELRKHTLKDNNVHRYVLEMIERASGYAIAEIDLVDIIVDGLNDNSRNVVMLYGAKTIQELKVLLPRYKKRRINLASQ
uniref:Retrotransposon gag domain-containing protein n=2 Tax=Anopheles coluzzii TaxID=1518534 RepID=A0A6E8W8H4_ANOCL|nr:uncharacterized protein LOC120958567 isoform X2 [Anopheles coluzzii]